MCVRVYVYVSASAHGVQKTESDLLELELRVTLSNRMWVTPAMIFKSTAAI